MSTDGAHRSVQHFGDLLVGPCKAVMKNHRGSLVIRQSLQAWLERWFRPRLLRVRQPNNDRYPGLRCNAVNPDPVQVPGRIVHALDLVPMTPGINQRIGGSIATKITTPSSNESPAKTRLNLTNETSELCRKRLGHHPPQRHSPYKGSSPSAGVTRFRVRTLSGWRMVGCVIVRLGQALKRTKSSSSRSSTSDAIRPTSDNV